MTAPALAQAAPASGATANGGTDDQAAGDIIVTAAKRSQRLIDVPNSVTAITADQLQQQSVKGLQDITTFSPGLIVSGSDKGRGAVIIRGIATALNAPANPVGTVLDGLPIGTSAAFAIPGSAIDINPADLERVEVLRGPQGTLYGANSLAGLISYVTKDPSLTAAHGEVDLRLAQVDSGGFGYDVSGGYSAPVVKDRIGIRVSGFYDRLPGFIDNPITGQKNINRTQAYGGRAALMAKVTDDVTVRLAVLAQNLNRNSQDDVTYSLTTFSPTNGPRDYARINLSPYNQKFRQYSGNVDWETSLGTLTSLTGYSTQFTKLRYDYSAAGLGVGANRAAPPGAVTSSGLYYTSGTDKFTQEVRLTSPDNKRFKYVIGGFYTYEDTSLHQEINPLQPNGQVYAPLNPTIIYEIPTTYREYAFFGNATYNITDRFELGGGIRYSHNNQTFRETAVGVIAAQQGLTVNIPKTTSQEGVVTYAATAKYNFTRQLNVYARASSGYSPGGPNFVVVGVPSTFRSESTNNYEVGTKSTWLDGLLSLDLSLYYIIFKNIQLNNQTLNGITYYTNGGKAVSKGVEFQGEIRPADGLTMTGNFTYNDAHLTEDAPALPATSGQRLPGTPHVSGSLAVDYRHPINENYGIVLGASGQYVGKRLPFFTGQTARVQFPLESYQLFNLRAGIQHGNLELTFMVRNVGNKLAKLSVLENYGRTVPLVTISPPRTYELGLHFKF